MKSLIRALGLACCSLFVCSVARASASNAELREVFEQKYEAWKAWVKDHGMLSVLAANQSFEDIVALGVPALPYLVEKIEENPEDFHLEWAVRRISKKRFEKAEWPDGRVGDSISAAKMCVEWWKRGRHDSGEEFHQLSGRWKQLRSEGEREKAQETYEMLINLGIAVLPYLAANVENEPELTPAILRLTGDQLPPNATPAQCKQWWEKNRFKWELPKTSDDSQRGQSEDPEEEVWGSPFEGAAISLRPSATQYKLGQRIELELRYRNVSEKEVTLLFSGFEISCKIGLFYADGRPVPARAAAPRPETATAGRMPPTFSTQIMVLGPGEVGTGFHVITLNPLFDIVAEGRYIAVVMYCPRSWADGFAISNLAAFEVKGPSHDDDSGGPQKTKQGAGP